MKRLRAFMLYLYLFLFIAPLLLPSYEHLVLLLQFGVVAPVYFLLLFCSAKLSAIISSTFFFCLCGLLVFGLPGTIVSWYATFVLGVQFGRLFVDDTQKCLRLFSWFVVVAMGACLYILVLNLIQPFSQEKLSDYFSRSSINTVGILAACSANLYMTILSFSALQERGNGSTSHTQKSITAVVVVVTSWSVLAFGFRSAAITLGTFIWRIAASFYYKFGSGILFFFFIGIISFVISFWSEMVQLILSVLVPGRSNLADMFTELGGESLRMLRLKEFWSAAALDKFNFDGWSEGMRFSALSDFEAAFFPISIMLLYPMSAWLASFHKLRAKDVVVTGYLSGFSSLAICLLQPDFFSLFSFFTIISIYFWHYRLAYRSAIRGKVESRML